jgi:pyridoxal phosphate enzyme (YggS family)
MGLVNDNTERILRQLPTGVQLVIAGKGRSISELLEAIDGGAKIIGENYVRDAEAAYKEIGKKVQWHFIGHLQKNKVKKAVDIFDMIETVDSVDLALEINKRCAAAEKTMPVLLEVNSAREPGKTGVMPDNVIALAGEISCLPYIKLVGLMTMGAISADIVTTRHYFNVTRQLFEILKQLRLSNSDLKYLSMGMSDSYQIALEEGANIVRIGTAIFGKIKSEVKS